MIILNFIFYFSLCVYIIGAVFVLNVNYQYFFFHKRSEYFTSFERIFFVKLLFNYYNHIVHSYFACVPRIFSCRHKGLQMLGVSTPLG